MIDNNDKSRHKTILQEEREWIQSGLDLINGFYKTVKTAKIYDANNINFTNQFQSFFSGLTKSLEENQKVEFLLRGSTLYYNSIKLKFGYANYNLFQFAREEFNKREMSYLGFSSELKEDDLREFIFLFAKKEKDSWGSLEDFVSELDQKGIHGISVEETLDPRKRGNPQRDATRIYFLGITHLKEMFMNRERKGKIPLLTTRRLIQSMINHIVHNESFIHGLTTIKNFDEYTLNHSINVCLLSLSLGKRLGFERNELVDLGISAFFHDYGKLDIPKEILDKPGKLDEAEREVIEKHPQYGAGKLIQLKTYSPLPLRAINVAMEHHLGVDKKGYPRYHKKTTLNLFSKIVKITDVYDAITTKRPYRKKDFTQTEALDFLLERSGTEFDPVILKVFVNMMTSCPVGSMVLLDTGELGIVFETHPEASFSMRPKVKLITDEWGNKIEGEIIDLAEIDSMTRSHKRSIVKTVSPDTYGVKISDYFVAQSL
jgi:HD-GYP domain-containing protein (c-di-GMP phosphodiesterase class II)